MPVGEDFERWYRAAYPGLVTALVAIAGDVSLGTDAADEACARAYERWERVGGMESPGGWTYRTGLHVLRRRFRRRAMEDRLLRRAAGAALPPPADWSTDVWEALRALPLRERTAVVLFHVADMPTDAVAEAMGVAPGTVGSTLSSARARLGHLLSEPQEVPDA